MEGRLTDLGKYRLIAELARGGMGDVYLAIMRGPARFNKLVVVKELRSSLSGDPEFLAMFLDEARLAARLSHPNVVQTNEVGVEGNRHFLAMEYLEGQTLQRILQRMKRAEPLSVAMHLRVLVDVCAGLQYAHELTDHDGAKLGVVHRDVSPQNVVVTYDGAVKLIDFGIAKAVDSTQQTRVGVLKGKVSYMSPEQALGGVCDRRSDIFAVGVMLWEAATGVRMWQGASDIAILSRLNAGKIPGPRAVSPAVPEELEAIVMKATASQPADRYQTAGELQMALEAYLAPGGVPALRDLGKLVAEEFRDERTGIQRIVDGQRRELRALASDDGAPMETGRVEQRMSVTPGAVSVTLAAGARDRSSQVTPVERAPRRGGTFRRVATLVGLIVLGEGFGLAGNRALEFAAGGARESLSERHRPPVVETAPAPAPASTAPAVETVRISLRATPEHARLFLDDAPLRANPFVGTVPKDAVLHRVHAEASGHVTRTELVLFDRDLVLGVPLLRASPSPRPTPVVARASLAASTPPAAHAPLAASAPVSPAPPQDDLPQGAPPTRPKREIDKADPWSQ